MENQGKTEKNKSVVKLKPESIKFELFGDMLKISKKNAREFVPLKKYDALAVHLVGLPRVERLMLYKFLCGLVLTAHARRTTDTASRKQLFEIKNRLFLNIANNFELRKILNFRFCISKRFKVVTYCKNCLEKHVADDAIKSGKKEKKELAFCNGCELDRTYYNVVSMFHKFNAGKASLYLGKEHLSKIEGLKPVKHVDLNEFPEQISFENFRFTPHNLIAVDLKSVQVCAEKLLAFPDEKPALPTEATHKAVTPKEVSRPVGMKPMTKTSRQYLPPKKSTPTKK